MSASYTIDTQTRVVRTTFDGLITFRDVAGLCAALASDIAFQPGFSELATFGQDCDLQLSFRDFHELSALDPFEKTSRRAFVVPFRRAVYGMVRMFQISRQEAPNVRIFDTVDEAWSWLMKSQEARPA